MTEELTIDAAFDLDFDPSAPGEAHDEAIAFIRYAKMCFIPGLSVEKVFESGVSLELPGITKTTYEKGQKPVSSGEPFAFPILKIKAGAKDKLFTIILREENENGEFDTVYRFKNYNEPVQEKEVDEAGQPVLGANGKVSYKKIKGDDGKYVVERNAFYDFQAPELDKLKTANPAGYAKLQMTGRALFNRDAANAWVYVKAFQEDTGYSLGNEVRQYLKDITIFNSREDFEKAKVVAGNSSKPSFDHYPENWKSDPAALQKFVKSAFEAGKAPPEIVQQAGLNGKAINGSEVDGLALVSEILGLPF